MTSVVATEFVGRLTHHLILGNGIALSPTCLSNPSVTALPSLSPALSFLTTLTLSRSLLPSEDDVVGDEHVESSSVLVNCDPV